MFVRVYVSLEHNAAMALARCADKEHRTLRDQAAFMLEKELERLGLLTPEPEPNQEKEE